MRSPGLPPRSPALPLPLMLNCIPSCTPAGISIETVSSPYMRPSPLQDPHLLVTVVPSPLQFRAGGNGLHLSEESILHSPHLPASSAGAAGLHAVLIFRAAACTRLTKAHVFTLIVLVAPLAISSKFNFSFTRRLLPWIHGHDLPKTFLPLRQRNFQMRRRQNVAKLAEYIFHIHASAAEAAPVATSARAKALWPKRSYCAFLSGSFSTSSRLLPLPWIFLPRPCRQGCGLGETA